MLIMDLRQLTFQAPPWFPPPVCSYCMRPVLEHQICLVLPLGVNSLADPDPIMRFSVYHFQTCWTAQAATASRN